MNETLKKRIKSFSWRLGMMGLVAIIGFVLENAELMALPMYAQIVLGLVAGEISKYLNSNA